MNAKTSVTEQPLPPALPSSFGLAVKLARTARGLSLEEFGRYFGLSKQRISQVETGTHPLSMDERSRWAFRLGLDLRIALPELDGHISRAVHHGRVTLTRLADNPRAWCAEGDGIDGTEVVTDAKLGRWIREKAESGIAVSIPPLPPIE